MRYCRLVVLSVIFPIIVALLGCSTGSSNPQPTLSKAQLLDWRNRSWESARDKPLYEPVDADQALRKRGNNLNQVLAEDSANTAAKFGVALSFTYEGLIQMTKALPTAFSSDLLALITQPAIGLPGCKSPPCACCRERARGVPRYNRHRSANSHRHAARPDQRCCRYSRKRKAMCKMPPR